MSADDGAAVGVGTPLVPSRRESLRTRLRGSAARWLVWIVGGAIVAASQPTLDRREAGAAAVVAGIAAVSLVRRLTESPTTRYLRSLLVGILAVSITADWGLRIGLGSVVGGTSFLVYGEAKKIILPFLFVLLAPLVLEMLPLELRFRNARQAALSARRRMRSMDWIVLAYAAIALPAVLIGLAHHWRLTYVAQDVGLVVFFVFLYVAGRASGGGTEVGAWAVELVDVLLLVALAQLVLFGWNIAPLYTYVEATCVGAIALVFMRPQARKGGLLRLTIAILLLGSEVAGAASRTSTASAVGLGLLMALGVLCYVAARLRPLVPTAALVAVAAVGLVGFVGFTHDGAALRGQYHGADQSNIGRTYEAKQVRAQVRSAPASLVFGRGFGSTIDETGAPPVFVSTLTTGGRDLAHVPEVHLLVYAFLLKEGLMGVAWLAVFGIGLVALAFRAFERAARTREPAFVVYTALPLIGIAAASAGASNLQADPLNALMLGVLVAFMGRARPVVTD